MTTPSLKMPLLTHNEYNGEVTHNDALQIMDFHGQGIVINHAEGAQPGVPDEGDAYIITSAWTDGGTANDIAHYYNATWHFYTPTTGWRVFSLANSGLYHFDGTDWILYVAATVPEPAYAQGYLDNAGTFPPTQPLVNGIAEKLAGFNAIGPQKGITIGLSNNEAVFTIPVTGVYRTNLSLSMSSTANGTFLLEFYVNGTASGIGFTLDVGNKDIDYASGAINVLTESLQAGDAVDIYIEAQQNCSVDYIAAIVNMEELDKA